MGMDVYGRTGNYFRRNVWGWHGLAEYICSAFPRRAAPCAEWHTNSGDGLDAEQSLLLADALDDAVASGEAERYVKSRDARLAALPDETCDLCHGTGIRNDDLGRRHGQVEQLISEGGHPRRGQRGWCNGCNGIGHIRPWDTHYYLEVDDITEFARFMRESGGFEIC